MSTVVVKLEVAQLTAVYYVFLSAEFLFNFRGTLYKHMQTYKYEFTPSTSATLTVLEIRIRNWLAIY